MNGPDCKTNPTPGDSFVYEAHSPDGRERQTRYVTVVSNRDGLVGFNDTLEPSKSGEESLTLPLADFVRRAAKWDIAPP